MSYTEYYCSLDISESVALGSDVWIKRAPVRAEDPDGRPLLGSLVKRNSPFLEHQYPVPRQYDNAGIFLDKLQEIAAARPDLKLPDSDHLVDVNRIAGVSVSMDSKTGLNLSGSAAIPGVPYTFTLAVDWSKTSKYILSFGEGSTYQSIRTGYLSRISEYCRGQAIIAFPTLEKSLIPSNYIVDMVVIAKNFTLNYTMSSKLDASFGAQATAATDALNGKVSVNLDTDSSFTIKVTDGIEYLVGLHTMRWSQLDSNPLPPPPA